MRGSLVTWKLAFHGAGDVTSFFSAMSDGWGAVVVLLEGGGEPRGRDAGWTLSVGDRPLGRARDLYGALRRMESGSQLLGCSACHQKRQSPARRTIQNCHFFFPGSCPFSFFGTFLTKNSELLLGY